MSATDPLKRNPGQRHRFRAIEPGVPAEGEGPASARRRLTGIKCSYRPADADFFCWKFGVWYNVMDCCYRHARQTYSGCSDCGQGEMNLRQHEERYLSIRLFGDPPRQR